MIQVMGTNFLESCKCLKIGTSFELQNMKKKAEPICIEYRAEPGIIIKHFRQAMGGTVVVLVRLLQLLENMIVGAPSKDNGNSIYEGAMYDVMMSFGETWTVDNKVTANDEESYEYFGWSVFISGYTLQTG